MNSITAQRTVDEIFALFEQYGQEAYGEDVTQIAHMVQAAQLAEQEGYPEEVILAAFLHDIGHLCASANASVGTYGAHRHERIGGDYLRQRGFSECVARLVENHVQAKRYLTYAQPGYYDTLSAASRQTLIDQGGRMNAEEAEAFEHDDLFELSLRMRYWDEAAKETGNPAPDVSRYRARCLHYLSA